jgi:hypothetical protein
MGNESSKNNNNGDSKQEGEELPTLFWGKPNADIMNKFLFVMSEPFDTPRTGAEWKKVFAALKLKEPADIDLDYIGNLTFVYYVQARTSEIKTMYLGRIKEKYELSSQEYKSMVITREEILKSKTKKTSVQMAQEYVATMKHFLSYCATSSVINSVTKSQAEAAATAAYLKTVGFKL